MLITIIIIAIIVLLVLFVIGIYNSLIKGRLSCDEAFSTMDVYMKKRFDLIPNLVETVKGYAKHEAETLEKVVMARNGSLQGADLAQAAKDENQISGALRQIFALSESYPELKANTNFMDLMESLKGIEGEIAQSRKYYNAVVKEYNTKIQVVPSNIIANMFGFKEKEMFLVSDEVERKNVKVSF